ncbi:MAG TPA: DNA translocase FtsK [Spirochaetota bacterium]|nr:DNA translocase FtsK [Spirochaetota bacterium]
MESSKKNNFLLLTSLLVGVLLAISFISYNETGKNLCGPAGNRLGIYLIKNFLGISAFFIPVVLLYYSAAGFFSLTLFKKHFTAMLALFSWFFTFNLLLLNTSLINSAFAGLLPLLIHKIILNYFGSRGTSNAGTLILESGFFLVGNVWLFTSLNRKIKQFFRETVLAGIITAAAFLKKRIKHFYSKLKNELANTVNKVNHENDTRPEEDIQNKNYFIKRIKKDNNKYLSADNSNGQLVIHKGKEGTPADAENSKNHTAAAPAPVSGTDNEVDFDLSVTSAMADAETGSGSETETGHELDKKPAVINKISATTFAREKYCIADATKLSLPGQNEENYSDLEIKETAAKLEHTIGQFNINTKVVEVYSGPVITRFELTIEKGVKISKIANLTDNIALSLAASSVRIVAPIPGKSVIGIEIPNKNRQTVCLRELVDHPDFQNTSHKLPMCLGKSLLGEPVITDLIQMPHLLIAGATGSGKSVCVNSLICSLLFKLPPSQIRLLLIDPKMVELNIYNDIPHLLSPVITDPKKASRSLNWVISEMEARYCLLEKLGVRSIESYNTLVKKFKKNKSQNSAVYGSLPYIVVVIDEFADLMMIARKDVENAIIRLAAMSRAVGIHLILATQRPSVDVITGIIKANFPSRIAFQVSSKIDARTILDTGGADKLMGKGDMLFQQPESSIPERIQGTFLSDNEVKQIVKNLIAKGKAEYIPEIWEDNGRNTADQQNDSDDPIFDDAVKIIIQDKKASASYLQRKLKIGYNRAARIIEIMEEMGLVGGADGSKPREVLVSSWKGFSG